MKNFVKEHEDTLKTIGIIIAIVLVLGVLFVVSENTGNRDADREIVEEEETNPLLEDGQVLNEDEISEIEEVSYTDFKSLLKKKTVTVIMIGYDECYWCQQEKPILGNVIYENSLTNVKYLNVNKLTDEEYEHLTSLHDDLASFGTPTFISIKNKKVTAVETGAKTKTQLVSMLTEMKVIK